ncbi:MULTISPECIES: 4-hydroxythreonine-4-phosphate dehydrogenase PdxA [unclassified Lentimonas]|uniref:4-hydroxythreonine-4-phosphate dehydrogenase PdxA n=1 Tax=unclassified Lentimonas TaxID=2630993 RepID=UPI00132C765F|nr:MULTISPECIES: 4-hydroxythreonine-4-phosphate dehydrogenase PdxA [unclassified Lentimonas]CAA6694925.1 4-hydroxythreonine-4-phosphate dehydrogenase (EC [Lentimonas sp. CC19]CAA6695234.1 4-hydroxythreonine-4-phosphate dehydrogenase (EC [Lentimonas sp. CC10]CAA7071962.1 4-hydroxythreonine-4-phosphate dehydrogenase (EC [Lentimonas sp. CC11]
MNNSEMSLPLAITCGDPAGIGPEVIATALRNESERERDCVLIGAASWAEPLAAELGIGFEAIGAAGFSAVAGQPSLDGAQVALAALQTAAQGCVDGRFRGVVSGPVSKHWLQQVGFKHPGQTEFFAEAWGGAPTMGFVGNELRVVLATWHIPLRDVADALTADCLELAVRRADALAKSFGVEMPRIGVCGLNPHAGEGGILGIEERDVLDPALDRLRAEMPGLSKCLPGDTVFFRQRRGEFDVVVSAYHDQGLAAVKTLEFDAAVNVTLGLPHVRTSPDHGTAFDLAGQGLADCGSFAAALSVARQLTGSKS